MNKQMQFLIYNAHDEQLSVNAVIKDETIWLTQKAMAELFGCSIDNISLHLKNIFNDGELHKEATIEKISIVQKEGNRSVQRAIEYYNLDAIISVGYRVNSKRATKFRQWAPSVLKEYMTKGFIVDSERLKQGKTAAEIVFEKSDHNADNMGLTTWKNAPDGRILSSDIIGDLIKDNSGNPIKMTEQNKAYYPEKAKNPYLQDFNDKWINGQTNNKVSGDNPSLPVPVRTKKQQGER